MKFKNLLFEDELNEVLITVGNKPYPLSGNVVILAGGAGSGKGFIKDKLLAIEGINVNVDDIKELSLKSELIKARALKDYKIDMSKMDLRNPEDVTHLHTLLSDMKVLDNEKRVLYTSILSDDPKFKPNIIFDVTLKDITKLNNLTADVLRLGYDKLNIHIVWVVNDVKVAIEQNKSRERVIPEDILVDTHEGASLTMKKIIDMGDNLNKYMDGSIIMAFNKKGVDIEMKTSDNGGSYISKAMYVVIKKPGFSVDLKQITSDVLNKIRAYTPKINTW
jgi:predicted kinase